MNVHVIVSERRPRGHDALRRARDLNRRAAAAARGQDALENAAGTDRYEETSRYDDVVRLFR